MLNDLKITSSDELKRNYVLAQKILWVSEGVSDGELLLTSSRRQPTIGECQKTVFSTKEGRRAAILLDFGCELAGGVYLVVKGGGNRKGLKVKLRFGESATEAMTPIDVKGACNDHSIRDMDVILPWNSAGLYGQTGFRFLYIELMESECYMELISALGVLMIRDIPYLGSFDCSDGLLKKIYDVCSYTLHLNMQELLWDGIKRDRLVWIGDMHPEILALRAVFGDQAIVDDSLREVAAQFPAPAWPNHITCYGMWYLIVLWDWYLYTERQGLLRELGPYWQILLRRLLKLVHEDGSLKEEEFERGFFIDWPTKGLPSASFGASALLSLALLAGENLCMSYGFNNEDMLQIARECREKRRLLGSRTVPASDKKQIIALSVLSGHTSPKEGAEILVEGCGRGMSTFMSFYILKATVKSAGMIDALRMLRQYYGKMLELGATTFWEDFDIDWAKDGAGIDRLFCEGGYDIHGDNGRFCYQGFRHSLCHGWSAGPAAFLVEETAGIRILKPGCRKLAVKPELGNLDWLKAVYPTPYGPVCVEAERKNGCGMAVKVDAPREIEIENNYVK